MSRPILPLPRASLFVRSVTAFSFGLLLLYSALPAVAATKAKPVGTMTIDGVTAAPVDVLAINWDANADTGRGAMTFSVVTAPDGASPALLVAALGGVHVLSGQVVLQGSGGPVATYDLTDVLITGVTLATDAKGVATEAIKLTFRKLTTTVSTPNGDVIRCWDFAQNQQC
jgi:type VI protein secretion system component Hcp